MTKLKGQVRGLLFFAYGSLIQLLFLRLVVLFGYPKQDPGRRFVDSYLVNSGVCLFGGIFTTWLMFVMNAGLRKEVEHKRTRVLFRGGLHGLLATFLTFQALFIITAVYLGVTVAHQEGGILFVPIGFSIALLEIETYGLISIAGLAPIAFLFGLGLGALQLRLLPCLPSCAT